MNIADNATIISSPVHAVGHTDAIHANITTRSVFRTVATAFSPLFTYPTLELLHVSGITA